MDRALQSDLSPRARRLGAIDDARGAHRMQSAVSPTPPAPMASPDRRSTDRRVAGTPMLSRYTLFGGRRAGDRRSPQSSNQYVDRYPVGLAVSLVTIGVLCALDAVFTLLHLQKGGGEMNPIMDRLMQTAGPVNFLVLKCAITNLGLVVLCLHKNFRLVKPVIALLLLVYVALFAFHIYLASTVS
jgi:hypothetical protein